MCGAAANSHSAAITRARHNNCEKLNLLKSDKSENISGESSKV